MIAKRALYFSLMLDCFDGLVRANRVCCDNDLASEAHDNMAMLFEELRQDLREHLAFESRAACETDSAMREDLACRLRQRERALDRYWFECQPYALGGWHRVDADGRFRNPVTGRRQKLDTDILTIPIPPERLCGLPALLPAIAAECPITFSAEIVFYRLRPKPTLLASQPKPFDPDAETPW